MTTEERRDSVVAEAEFEGKLKTYWFLRVLVFFVVSIVGIVLIPVWVLGWGQWWSRRRFENLRCVLNQRSLVVERGVLFKVEKTIPLDKIQDLTVTEGPLLKAFGLRSLRVETAGQSSPQGTSDADLVGVVDPRSFRDRVLDQRDRLLGTASPPIERERPASASVEGLLIEIRDLLGALVAQGDSSPLS